MNAAYGAGSGQGRRSGPGIERDLGAQRWSAPSSERCGEGWPQASEQPPIERRKRAASQSMERSSREAGIAGSNVRAQQRPSHQCTSPGPSAMLLARSGAASCPSTALKLTIRGFLGALSTMRASPSQPNYAMALQSDSKMNSWNSKSNKLILTLQHPLIWSIF